MTDGRAGRTPRASRHARDSHTRSSGHAGDGHADESPHAVVLTFPYPDEETARIVERSVRQEVDDVEGDRTRATVSRDRETLTVDVAADDLVALRAGLNTWCTLVDVAERSSAACESSSRAVTERSSTGSER